MSKHLTSGDRLRRWSYLQDVSLWLDPMSGSQRRAIVRELRTNLAEAAEHDGMRAAIADLGPARVLARAYVDGEPRRRPMWGVGATVTALVLGLFLYTGLAYAAGLLDALSGVGGGAVAGNFLGITLDARVTAGGMWVEASGFSWFIAVVLVVTFLLVSRAWRQFLPAPGAAVAAGAAR